MFVTCSNPGRSSEFRRLQMRPGRTFCSPSRINAASWFISWRKLILISDVFYGFSLAFLSSSLCCYFPGSTVCLSVSVCVCVSGRFPSICHRHLTKDTHTNIFMTTALILSWLQRNTEWCESQDIFEMKEHVNMFFLTNFIFNLITPRCLPLQIPLEVRK
jgi:hypothetical protein